MPRPLCNLRRARRATRMGVDGATAAAPAAAVRPSSHPIDLQLHGSSAAQSDLDPAASDVRLYGSKLSEVALGATKLICVLLLLLLLA